MDFQKINEQLTTDDPQTFLQAVLAAQDDDEASEILFSETIDAQFVANCQYLATPETISTATLSTWRQSNFLVVGQTLDGDYVGGTDKATLVIPVSLYQADVEQFSLPLRKFFCAYQKQLLTSVILPKNL